MIDLEKRRRVMARSAALGHCICNPRQPCPCDTFRTHDVCPCAGERLPDERGLEEVLLTELVENAGCASKINQRDLRLVLDGLPEITHERLLVGTNACDDAGVYRLTDDLALVQTVDVFTPGVDDPYLFGQIAAANSLSDCYAMGGTPLTALAVIGFPIDTLSHEVMRAMLRGGMETIAAAGAVVVGGHSMKDSEPKFGFAVTGTVDPRAMITNAGARPGDALVLTKPLGVGIISFARQLGRASATAMAAAGASMARLNDVAARLMVELGAHAATDVTGFGLLGHLAELTRQSGVTAQIDASRVPVFAEALEYVRAQMISGAIERNLEYAQQFVTVAEGVDPNLVHVLHDPQTSGGLLIAIAAERAEELVARLHAEGVPDAAIIGCVTEDSEGRIVVTGAGTTAATVAASAKPAPTAEPCCSQTPSQVSEPCCAEPPGEVTEPCCAQAPDLSAGTTEARAAFGAFMSAVNAPGAVDLRTRELIAIALSAASRCAPCLRLHIEKARGMGITDEEINEAVWMAISMGGAPVMMFVNELRGE